MCCVRQVRATSLRMKSLLLDTWGVRRELEGLRSAYLLQHVHVLDWLRHVTETAIEAGSLNRVRPAYFN